MTGNEGNRGTAATGSTGGYIGRFAPSPTGPLHAGSLVAAMASYLDARAHHGQWRVRIEDVDEARTVPGAAESILQTLALLGMQPNGEVIWQSRRGEAYAAAFAHLQAHVYPCGCSRREIADSNAGVVPGGLSAAVSAGMPSVYPGICRHGMPPGRSARAWRLRVPASDAPDELIGFQDRACGWQEQHLADEAGDFVLKRADGFWAYQLAVVVDDAAQGITDVVRGKDLLDSTPRQIYLQRLLGIPTPRYLHTPLVRNAAGEKLSKQTGAAPLDLSRPGLMLRQAAAALGLQVERDPAVPAFWEKAIPLWAARFSR
ncbi:MAG: tRNA glutamyl-Q(34) synthetase GluQRS [Herminiimonas sp.]|nr:tRNA glutamyl-Q(34) synthetase GluQRS [Herminiimonas sp.]